MSDDIPTVMYLVRNRAGGDSWAEWDDIWPDLIRKVSERCEEQKGTHPGFDVIEVVIERHAVVRPSVAVDGATVGWHDAPLNGGSTPNPTRATDGNAPPSSRRDDLRLPRHRGTTARRCPRGGLRRLLSRRP